jgi:hypothetical protein
MAVNLIRNARVFFTTNVKTDGSVKLGGVSGVESPNHQAVVTADAFTQELQVLDGFSFSQNTTAETISINESGETPKRGQRSFNTSIDPVEWSFSTYVRPQFVEGTSPNTPGTLDADDKVICEERVLWNALFASDKIGTATSGTTGAAYSEVASTGTSTPYARIVPTFSEKNQLQKFGLIVMFDDQTYMMDNCALESATIDFGIDQIATIQWSGKAVTLRRLANNGTVASAGNFGGSLAGTFAQKATSAAYITNKLSAATLISPANLFGLGGTSVTYDLAITGGNVTIANNLSYLIPANIGTLNKAIDYYTGARSVTGSITAYLRVPASGNANNTGGLFKQIVDAAATDDENMFAITLGMGGTTTIPTTTSNQNKVLFYFPQAMVQFPQVNTDQIVSTTINFMAQSGYSSGTTQSGMSGLVATAGTIYEQEVANEVAITYFAAQ